jgi:hypothetical protein
MRRSLGGLLAISLVVSACQAVPTSTAAKGKKPTAAASAKPTAAPSSAATTKPFPAPTAPIDATAVTGLLKMDASYVIAAGGGNVIAAGGGNVVAAGGGNVIAAGGGNLISVGGQVIAAGGGNVVAAGGGNVIAAGGGNAVASGGANYRVADIAVTETKIPYGIQLPAVGMGVVAVSLRTGKILSEAVLTDGEGRYTVHVPKSESGNFRIVAAVPAKSADDPILKNKALQSESIAHATTDDVLVDDDRATVSRFFREVFVSRLMDTLSTDGTSPIISGVPLFDSVWQQLVDAAVAAKTRDLPEPERLALATSMADNMIYFVNFKGAKVDRSIPNYQKFKDETSFEAFAGIMRVCRDAAAAKMANDPDYFAKASYVEAANKALRVGAAPYTFKKPSDLTDFVVHAYFLDSGRIWSSVEVLKDLGVDEGEIPHFVAAQMGFQQAIGVALIADTQARDALQRLITDATKK